MVQCVVAAALMAAPVAVGQSPPPALKLAVAGNDSILWLVVGQQEGEQGALFHRFAFQDKSSARILAVSGIRPQKGRMERWAVVGENLHVFFGPDEDFPEDGAHYSYDRSARRSERSGVRREIPLPGPVMPIAVAGESAGHQPRLWAVVSAATAAAVQAQWEQTRREQATQPAEPDAEAPHDESAPQSPGDAIPPPGSAFYHLVSYNGVSWQPGFPATSECGESQRVWLALGENRFYLLWQRSQSEPVVHCAWYRQDLWTIGPSISLEQPLADGFAGVINRELVFAALSRHEADPQRLRCRAWVFHTGADGTGHWRMSSPLVEDPAAPDEELSLAIGSAVGGGFDKLAVLRPGEHGAETAFFSPSLGGAPGEPFREVPLAKSTPGEQARRGLRDLAAMLVVVAVVALVFWRRQESISMPLPMPEGRRVVGPGKRALMALLDMIPAAAVVTILWFDPISGYCREFYDAAQTGQTQALEELQWPESLTWAWMWFRLVYTAYCIGFEIVWRATPGKRLLRCEVCSETLDRPNAVHIIIRNITKLIELEPYLQIWPFMLVIILMRNNQRVGDLLARTIVVQRQD